MADVAVTNPFTTEQASGRDLRQSTTEVAVQRELGEVQAAVLMARRFPRDPVAAMDAILRACTRPTLAGSAVYSYARGGSDIAGPSIRLAEVMAQAWGNLTFGIRELEQRAGESTMEAYCWDLESNVRQSRIFQIKHERHTRDRTYRLTDPRDIYEANANAGARRLRACILGILPGDITEAAVSQCEETLRAEADVSPEGIKKLVEAFAQFGVSREQIEVRCQRRLDAIRPAQVVQLRKIWASLRDEMSQPGDWFEAAAGQPQTAPAPATGNEALRQRLTPVAEPANEAAKSDIPAATGDPAASSPDRSRDDEPLSHSDRPEGDVPAEPGVEIRQIKPKRRPRGGWDWPAFVDEVITVAGTVPPDQLGEFRAANRSMLDTLQRTDKELWSRVQQAFAEQ
jgi:hypothetical protein